MYVLMPTFLNKKLTNLCFYDAIINSILFMFFSVFFIYIWKFVCREQTNKKRFERINDGWRLINAARYDFKHRLNPRSC